MKHKVRSHVEKEMPKYLIALYRYGSIGDLLKDDLANTGRPANFLNIDPVELISEELSLVRDKIIQDLGQQGYITEIDVKVRSGKGNYVLSYAAKNLDDNVMLAIVTLKDSHNVLFKP